MVERLGEWFHFSAELYCRKVTVYERMHWDLSEEVVRKCVSPFSLANCALVSVAPFGGPVAIVHSIVATDSGARGFRVHVYTSAGEFQVCLSAPADVGAPIDMGWTKEESLVILTEQQACVFFDCNFAGSFSSTEREGVASTRTVRLQDISPANYSSVIREIPKVISCLRPDGLFCMDEDGWLRGMQHEESCSSVVLDPMQLELDSAPAALDFIPPECNDESKTVLYVAMKPMRNKGDSTLCVLISNAGVYEKLNRHIPGGITAMKVNQTGSQIAIFTERSILYILSSNLNSVDFSIDLGPRGRQPTKLDWCGHSFVMLHYNDSNLLSCYNSHRDAPMFSLLISARPGTSVKCERLDWEREGSGHVATVSEVDGVRVITEKSCYMLEEVARSLVNLCRIKSPSNSAQLIAAYTCKVKRLLNMRELLAKWGGTTFVEVVDEIIDAAAHEFSPDQQHLLFSAVFFANEVSRQYDFNILVDVVRRLSMLHAVRNYPGCHMPLSFRQYCCLSGLGQMRSLMPSEARVLVDRLANRSCFQLALDITEAFNMKPLSLLSWWSCHKVRTASLNDTTIFAHIQDVLSRYPGSSYVESAVAALRIGRSALAIQLLNEDFHIHTKVIVLLLIGQWELAVHWAAAGNDADLLHLTLSKILTSVREREKLFSVLLEYPTAVAWLLHGSPMVPTWRPLVEEMCLTRGDTTLALFYVHSLIERAVQTIGGKSERDQRNALMFSREVVSNCTVEQTCQSEKNNAGGACDSLPETDVRPILSYLTPPALSDVEIELRRCIQLQRGLNGDFERGDGVTGYPLFFLPGSRERMEEELNWLNLHHQLMDMQRLLAEEYNDPRFIHCTIARTIFLCILHDGERHAEKLRVRYRISEKKYLYMKFCALCDAARWEEAAKLCGSSSSGRFASKLVIAPLLFIEQFFRHSQVKAALQLIPYLDNTAERVEWFLRLGKPLLAIDDAFHEGDALLIQNILKKTHDVVVQEYGAQRLRELK